MDKFKRAIIKGAINSDGVEYKRLRVEKRYWRKFNNINKLTVKYHGDYFIANIKNKLFKDYGEIDNVKTVKWFKNKHVKLDVDITYLHNLKEIELI